MQMSDNGSGGSIVWEVTWKQHIAYTILTLGMWLLYVPIHKFFESLDPPGTIYRQDEKGNWKKIKPSKAATPHSGR